MATDKPPGPPDWDAIDFRLMHGKARLRPWEIQRLTIAEITAYLDDDVEKPRPPRGGRAMSHDEVVAYAERRRKMTLQDRLAAAKGK